MVDFRHRLLNFPVERLFKPKKRLPGYDVSIPKGIIPFQEKETALEKVHGLTDVICFTDYFTESFGYFDNVKDFKEYSKSNTLYQRIEQSDPDDLKDEYLMKVLTALKYPFALQRMLQALAADDTVYTFNLPFLRESASDFEASFLLIEYDYFKQALQALRSAIEVTLAHAYFGLLGMDFDDLARSVDFRMPPLRRGKKSLLGFLGDEGLLNDELKKEIVELYSNLSGTVHSEIGKLNIIRKYYDSFDEWYKNLIKTGQLSLKLVLRMVEKGM